MHIVEPLKKNGTSVGPPPSPLTIQSSLAARVYPGFSPDASARFGRWPSKATRVPGGDERSRTSLARRDARFRRNISLRRTTTNINASPPAPGSIAPLCRRGTVLSQHLKNYSLLRRLSVMPLASASQAAKRHLSCCAFATFVRLAVPLPPKQKAQAQLGLAPKENEGRGRVQCCPPPLAPMSVLPSPTTQSQRVASSCRCWKLTCSDNDWVR